MANYERHLISSYAKVREAFGNVYRSYPNDTALTGDQRNLLEKIEEAKTTNKAALFLGDKNYWRFSAPIDVSHYLEMPALSPNIRFILYPKSVFTSQGNTKNIEFRKPQSLLFLLNNFTKDAGTTPNATASFLFYAAMHDALMKKQFFVEEGAKSSRFIEAVRESLQIVRDYVGNLDPQIKNQLSRRIATLAGLSVNDLGKLAMNISRYQVEFRKNIFENDEEIKSLAAIADIESRHRRAKDAVTTRKSFLHCSERLLPRKSEKNPGSPALPWIGYGKETYGTNFQMYGRYRLPLNNGAVYVDYCLDENLASSENYVDLYTLEIRRLESGKVKEHIVICPYNIETAFDQEALPVVLAGKFDFSDCAIRPYLEALADDPEIRYEVKTILSDVLNNANSLMQYKSSSDQKETL